MADSPLGTTIEVGTVRRAEPVPEAREPGLLGLWIELGDREVRSAVQLGYHHDAGGLVGTQVLCATGLGTATIAGFESEAPTVGVPGDDGNPVLVTPVEDVPEGGEIF